MTKSEAILPTAGAAPRSSGRARIAAVLPVLLAGASMAQTTEAPTHTNRLAGESSPYLLQHAHNPVDWFPWGPEAFEEARRRDVPIFLSVGYATCYWCHVMERESFENDAIAEQMNRQFVCVKVDREQRPEVDDIYMAAVQALSGGGGWPMSVFLTPPGARGPDDPGLEPYWGGTYFPPEPRFNRPSFPQVLDAMSNAWAERRNDVLEQAAALTDVVREQLAATNDPVRLGPDRVTRTADVLMRTLDRTHGGFGGAPKFPQPVFLRFLIDALPSAADPGTRTVVEQALQLTLDRMALGGMYDQVGGGFHRYSTDEKWLIPHFEKMLYDNAQLASLYALNAVRTSDDFHARIARETCEYVLREMTSPEGVFYSAQDAEVNAREGQNYLWTKAQIAEVLPEDDAALAVRVFGVDLGPNFRDPHHTEEPASNVLFLLKRPSQLAASEGMTDAEFATRLASIKKALYAARAKRDQPITDDKALTSWNGLMIAGLAETGRALREPRYVEAASRAADFILESMRDPDGLLYRVWRDGRAEVEGVLEDYAFLIKGLLALHLAAGAERPEYLVAARDLATIAESRFGAPGGGYFDTAEDQRHLIVRARTVYDGAVPSPSGVMLHNLINLHDITGVASYLDAAGGTLASLSRAIADNPTGSANAVRGLVRFLRLSQQRDEDLLARYGVGDDAPDLTGEAPTPDGPVQILSDRQAVQAPGGLTLLLRIADGYHVNAPEPGIDGLEGLRVEVAGGTGVRAVADFPAPEQFRMPWMDAAEVEALNVYSGEVQIPVRFEPTGEEWTGKPQLVVIFQVCTESECMAPTQATLSVQIAPTE